MLMIVPVPRDRIAGTTSRARRSEATVFVSKIARRSSSEVSSKAENIELPALLIRASMRPNLASTSISARCAWAESVTSSGT
jgi:hypothetical protein